MSARLAVAQTIHRDDSRRGLILAMANMDGVAHVDPTVTDKNAEFTVDDLGVE
jgi:hypothetical protein